MFLEILEIIKNSMITIFPIVKELNFENLIKSLPGGLIILIIFLIIKYHKQIIEFIILLKDIILSIKDHF